MEFNPQKLLQMALI